jgi:hypothetical protein
MDECIKTYKTIFILSNEKYYNQLTKKDKNAIDYAKRNLDKTLLYGIGFAIGSTFIYHKLSYKLLKKNIVRKSSDIVFILGFTTLTSYVHHKFVNKINMGTIRNKYSYILKNALMFDDSSIINNNDRLLNHLHRLNIKHFYFIVYLILRILIK